MLAVLQAAPAADAITLPLVLTVAAATVSLVAIAMYVRRNRRAGTMNGVTATASGVTAAGVLASALLVTVVIGNASAASAEAPRPADSSSFSTPSNDLSGPQLPTE
ncbi:hypothetical protein BH09ACT3_BH09ACT3_17080 [soil metagenome]